MLNVTPHGSPLSELRTRACWSCGMFPIPADHPHEIEIPCYTYEAD
ncbi:MAG TPA: hypothetical protein PLA27_08615 [Anaerolineales bacterium]|jgi:hypothetical protein|nr:hypothetical protein [Anaerolineales bacterium]HQX16471.1 hypothetical protein [Anaerolineales bacterium]